MTDTNDKVFKKQEPARVAKPAKKAAKAAKAAKK